MEVTLKRNNAGRHLLCVQPGNVLGVTPRWHNRPRPLPLWLSRYEARGRGPWSAEAPWNLNLMSGQTCHIIMTPIVLSFESSHKWRYKNSKRLRIKTHNPPMQCVSYITRLFGHIHQGVHCKICWVKIDPNWVKIDPTIVSICNQPNAGLKWPNKLGQVI